MKCPTCGRDNPAGNRFCNFCGGALVPAGAPATSKVTAAKPVPFGQKGVVAALIVFVVCAVISLVFWGPLSLPSSIINNILPNVSASGMRPGTLAMYLYSGAIGLKTIAVPVALLVLVLRLRKVLSRGVAYLTPKLPASSRFLVAPTLATMVFVLAWAGAHYEMASQTGFLPQRVFPAIIGLFTFATASYGASLQRPLAPFFWLRDKFPRWMRLAAATAIPLVIALVITNQERVTQETLKEQFVVLVALGTSYLALAPRGGGLPLGGGRPDSRAVPKASAKGGTVLRSLGWGLGIGWLLYLFRELFLADVALAHDCSGPSDCLQTAGYNATLGIGGGIMGVGATMIGSSLAEPMAGLVDKPFLMPGSGEAAKAAEALFTKLSPEEQRRQQEMLAEQDRRWQVIQNRADREARFQEVEDAGAQVAEKIAPHILAPWITENKFGKIAIDYLGRSAVSQVTDTGRILENIREVYTGQSYSISGERTPLNKEELAQARDELYREGFKRFISFGIGQATEVEHLGTKILERSLTWPEAAKAVVNQSADSIAAGIEKSIDWLLGRGG